MSQEWSNLYESLSKNKVIKFCFSLAAIVFTIFLAIAVIKAATGHYVKFFGLEVNVPKEHPDTAYTNIFVHDTTRVIKYDTIYKTIGTLIKKSKSPISQKIESGGSGLQNNAPNYGDQAGRDINNYGIIPRKVTEENLLPFLNAFPDKNTHIAISFIGSPDGEMNSVKYQIIEILRNKGYINIGEGSGIAMAGKIPDAPYYEQQLDGSVLFWVPPNKQ